jgi:outer membrane protein TolC
MVDILKQSHCHTVSRASGCVTGVARTSPVHRAAPLLHQKCSFGGVKHCSHATAFEYALMLSSKELCGVTVCVLLGVVAGAELAVAAPLSYEDARDALHTVSDLQKSGESGVSRSEHEARAADSLGWPDLSVNATEVFGLKTGNLDTPLGTIRLHDDFTGPRSSVDSTWSIYTGGQIKATQRALAAAVDQSRAELAGTEQHLDLELTQVYFGVALAANVESTRTEQLQQADRLLERAVRFEQQGVIAKVERLNAQVSRDEAARELVRAQSDRKIAEARLERLLHRDTPIDPSTPLFVITDALQPLPDWLDAADRQHPIFAAFDARRKQAEQDIVIAQALWKPKLFAYGSYSLINEYHTITEPDWTAGIGVNFTLFSRVDRASKVSAARAQLQQVQALEEESRKDIHTAVETSYRKVEQAREQFKLLESSLTSARENLRLRERGFDEGQATSLDVNDARDAVTRAQTARALAAYDFVVALAELLEASGQARALPEHIQRADIRLQT